MKTEHNLPSDHQPYSLPSLLEQDPLSFPLHGTLHLIQGKEQLLLLSLRIEAMKVIVYLLESLLGCSLLKLLSRFPKSCLLLRARLSCPAILFLSHCTVRSWMGLGCMRGTDTRPFYGGSSSPQSQSMSAQNGCGERQLSVSSLEAQSWMWLLESTFLLVWWNLFPSDLCLRLEESYRR